MELATVGFWRQLQSSTNRIGVQSAAKFETIES